MSIMRSMLFSVLCLSLTFSLAFSAEKNKSSSLKELFKTADNTVVFISAGGKVQGSGVSIKNENLLAPGTTGTLIVTNAHVVGDFKNVTIVTNKKTKIVGEVVVIDKTSDLALVQIEGIAFKISTLAPADVQLDVGENVFTVGSPKGMSNSLSEGIISGFRQRALTSIIQTTSAISKGSSGGGLFDRNGKLIGITTFKITDGENVNFAVHIKHLHDLLNKPNKVETVSPISKSTEEELEEVSKRKLTEMHPDWEAIVTSKEFTEWTKSLSKSDRERLNESWDPYFIAEEITLFKQRKANNQLVKESTEPSPKLVKEDKIVLVCSVENTSLTFVVDFDNSTVSGYPATISSTSIKRVKGADTVVIDRYSGDLSLVLKGQCIRGSDCIYYGKCSTKQNKQF